MRQLLIGLALAAMTATTIFILPAFGQSIENEGKAWLNACSEPAALNVAGVWKDPKWGNISLSQRKDSRQIMGSGDGWIISGVVSGKSVCLLFYTGRKIGFSAKLTENSSGDLIGEYAKGMLSEGSKTIPMNLVKMK